MGCSRQYVYKLVKEGKLPASRISSRMAFIRKADIEKMLTGNPYYRVLPGAPTNKPCKTSSSLSSRKDKNHIPEFDMRSSEPLDYISGEDVMCKYGKTYYSKKHLDEIFRPDLKASDDYYTTAEAAEKYGMTKSNICVIVKTNHLKR